MDLTCKFQIEATMVANEFIDRYMADANGEYVKVYLYLLRHASEKLDVGTIADALNHTEADVKRAVLYWQKVGNCACRSEECDNLSEEERGEERIFIQSEKERSTHDGGSLCI